MNYFLLASSSWSVYAKCEFKYIVNGTMIYYYGYYTIHTKNERESTFDRLHWRRSVESKCKHFPFIFDLIKKNLVQWGFISHSILRAYTHSPVSCTLYTPLHTLCVIKRWELLSRTVQQNIDSALMPWIEPITAWWYYMCFYTFCFYLLHFAIQGIEFASIFNCTHILALLAQHFSINHVVHFLMIGIYNTSTLI